MIAVDPATVQRLRTDELRSHRDWPWSSKNDSVPTYFNSGRGFCEWEIRVCQGVGGGVSLVRLCLASLRHVVQIDLSL